MRGKVCQWGRVLCRVLPLFAVGFVSCHPQKSEPPHTPRSAGQETRTNFKSDALSEGERRPMGKVVVEGRFPSLEVRLENCDDGSVILANSISFTGGGRTACLTRHLNGGYWEPPWRVEDPDQTEYCRLVPGTYGLTAWGLGIGMATFTLFEDGGYRVDNKFCGDDADYEVSAEPGPEAEVEGVEDQKDENPSSESEAVEGYPNASETE